MLGRNVPVALNHFSQNILQAFQNLQYLYSKFETHYTYELVVSVVVVSINNHPLVVLIVVRIPEMACCVAVGTDVGIIIEWFTSRGNQVAREKEC